MFSFVMPVQADIQSHRKRNIWIPACTEMTVVIAINFPTFQNRIIIRRH